MNNINDKNREKEKQMGRLQDKLDIAVFEQEEIDPEQVKEILKEMERISPPTEEEWEKELRWEKIRRECREEFEAEEKNAQAGRGKRKSYSGKIRKAALMAAALVSALFIGANIGTYATEKKSVFEFVEDLGNGISYRINGDVSSMEVEKSVEVYYSWNELPNEYKSMLIVPKGIPKELQMYEIKVSETAGAMIKVLYLNDAATVNVSFQIVRHENNEFSMRNLLHEEDYVLTDSKQIDGIEVSYFQCDDGDIAAQFLYENNWYIFFGNIESEILQNIVEDTIKENFM